MAARKPRFDLSGPIQRAKKRTDEELAKEVAALTRMTSDEVQVLFPKTADVEKLNRLMEIVKSGSAKNKKVKQIADNAEEFAGVLLTLLGKFV